MLDAIESLAHKQVEAEEHIKRLERLEKVLDNAPTLRRNARRNSKELSDQMAKLMDGAQ